MNEINRFYSQRENAAFQEYLNKKSKALNVYFVRSFLILFHV